MWEPRWPTWGGGSTGDRELALSPNYASPLCHFHFISCGCLCLGLFSKLWMETTAIPVCLCTRPVEAAASQTSLSALAHLWVSSHPKLFGWDGNISRLNELASSSSALSQVLVRPVSLPPVRTPLGLWFRRTSIAHRLRRRGLGNMSFHR